MSSSTIDQAVDLLLLRRTEAMSERDTLTDEIDRITDALRTLGVDDTPTVYAYGLDPFHVAARVETRPSVQPTSANGSVRSAVLALLNGEHRLLSTNDIVNELRAYQGDREDAQFRSTIRTALWSLRNDGAVDRAGQNRYRATKWRTGGDTSNPEAPTAGTVGASDLSLLEQEGGTGSDGQPQHQDEAGEDRSDSHTRSSVPDRGAAVVVAP